MKGFSLTRGSKTTFATLETGNFGLTIFSKNGVSTISLGGMDAQGVDYVWYDGEIFIDDPVTIKYEDVDESMISEPIRITEAIDKELKDKLLLDSYYKLKQKLLDEGLISK